MTSDAPPPSADAKQEALDAVSLEKIEQGVVHGWLSTKYNAARLSVNGRVAAVIDEDRLLPADAADGGHRRRFALDLRSLAPDLLLDDRLSFEIRPVAGSKDEVGRLELPTTAFLKPIVAKRKPPGLEGCIDEYEAGRLRGWVWDGSNPLRPVSILVFLEDRFIGRYVADHYRPDLADLGKGEGRAGFDINISAFYQISPDGGDAPKVYTENPEGWAIPLGQHLRPSIGKKIARFFRGKQEAALAWLPGTTEEFVNHLAHSPPYPKKIFDIATIASKKMPDPFAADYTLLAIEFLRREAVALSEAMPKDGENWRQHEAQLRAVESQLAHLCRLGEAIAASQKLMRAASEAAAQPSGKQDEDRRRKA
ncbi:MAG: hypothetical protein N2444_05640 [Methylocystis sp.]|nr:hypothetical protein [Methylocystis sp.]